MESQSPDCLRSAVWLPLFDPAGRPTLAPISHPGAVELFGAIAVSIDRPAAHWQSLLSCEPGLAVWVSCRASADERAPLRTLAEAVDWLATSGAKALLVEWPAARGLLPRSTPECSARHWAERSAHAVQLSACAAHLAEEGKSPCVHEVAWLAMLRDASGWLIAAVPSSQGAAEHDPSARSTSPHWLETARSFAAMLPGDGVDWVGLAASDGQRKESPSRGKLPATSKTHLAAIRQRWLEPAADAGWVLEALQKLARLDRLEREFHLALEAEKLEAVKELAYGAGHEINNPLANISARAQTLLDDERDPERRRRLAAINAQAFRAHEMIADMMLFARPPAPRLARLELGRLLTEVARSIEPLAAEQATSVRLDVPTKPLFVMADGAQLAVAIRALAVNALEALREGGELTMTMRDAAGPVKSASSLHSTQAAEIVVADNGPGIPEAIRPRIFDPYFSGREAGRGIGFGLCKCWRIVTEHGGNLAVADNPSGGASFTILLPGV